MILHIPPVFFRAFRAGKPRPGTADPEGEHDLMVTDIFGMDAAPELCREGSRDGKPDSDTAIALSPGLIGPVETVK